MLNKSPEDLMVLESIITQVISQIQVDIYEGELAPLFEMLSFVDLNILKGYLSEAEFQEKLRWN